MDMGIVDLGSRGLRALGVVGVALGLYGVVVFMVWGLGVQRIRSADC